MQHISSEYYGTSNNVTISTIKTLQHDNKICIFLSRNHFNGTIFFNEIIIHTYISQGVLDQCDIIKKIYLDLVLYIALHSKHSMR